MSLNRRSPDSMLKKAVISIIVDAEGHIHCEIAPTNLSKAVVVYGLEFIKSQLLTASKSQTMQDIISARRIT